MKWLKGLIGAIVGGAANAVTMMVVDPMTYNINDGLSKIGTVALVSGIVSGCAYLKTAPMPGGSK